MVNMKNRTQAFLNRLSSCLLFCLANVPFIIKTKDGKLAPLVLNKAQKLFHEACEKMYREVGYVRIIVVKGRQQGISTYIAARFYHKTRFNVASNTFILSHEAKSTSNLFGMVKRFNDKLPIPFRPKLRASNAKELLFEELDSGYAVGTAGNQDVGRSMTNSNMHLSEAAFYRNTDELQTGLMQTVPMNRGEIIIESTGNGIGGMFHQTYVNAELGKNEYRAVFIPWFLQDEYRVPLPKAFKLTDEEIALKEAHGLDDEQINFRRIKIGSFEVDGGDGVWKFKQEYPCTAEEAFQTSGDCLIKPQLVVKARKSTYKDTNAPIVLGVDGARDGDDTALVARKGRQIVKHWVLKNMNEMKLAGIILKIWDNNKISHTFIDCAYGSGTYDRLVELGYGKKITKIYFNEGTIDEQYLNKRAEMWCEMAKWFKDEPVNIPDDNRFQMEVCSMPDYEFTSNKKKKFPPKEEIKIELGFSPDLGDATALTFAYPVGDGLRKTKIKAKGGIRSSLRRSA